MLWAFIIINHDNNSDNDNYFDVDIASWAVSYYYNLLVGVSGSLLSWNHRVQREAAWRILLILKPFGLRTISSSTKFNMLPWQVNSNILGLCNHQQILTCCPEKLFSALQLKYRRVTMFSYENYMSHLLICLTLLFKCTCANRYVKKTLKM